MNDNPFHGVAARPLVSISIVTWNSIAFIEQCLRSVFVQEGISGEIIVVDNASKDGTVEYLEQLEEKITLIRIPFNSGYSHAHNIAINSSSAPYISCLNPDVFLEPEYLLRAIEFLESNPRFGGAIGKILQCRNPVRENWEKYRTKHIDTMGLAIEKSRHFIARRFDLPDRPEDVVPEEVFGVDGMAPVYRRQMLSAVAIEGEYFDEQFFAYCEDQDLSWRARVYGWQFACVPSSVAYHVRTWKPSKISARKMIGAIQRRHAIRNHYWMIFKNDCVKLALLHLPYITTRFILILGFSVLFERGSLLAFYEILRGMPLMFRKRKFIMTRKSVTWKEMLGWYNGSDFQINRSRKGSNS